MALTAKEEQAYEMLSEAIENAMVVFDRVDSGGFVVGWVLIVNSVRSLTDSDKENDDRYIVDDEYDVASEYDFWTKRGQNPALTRGIAEDFIDEIRGGLV